MRILHTSDWHLGRQLHGLDLASAQEAFVDHLVEVVRSERVDVVLVSGDVHDRALPGVQALQLFSEALRRLRDVGASVIAISGNHDAANRLGDKAELLDPRIQILTDPAAVGRPVIIDGVAFYGIPYLEPAVVSGVLPGVEGDEQGSHTRVLARAMRAVSADRDARGGPAVVLAHAWVAGGEGSDSERELGVGGVARVPVSLFDGITYTALGHLHGPQVLADGLRYSGSPLPYSFSEAGHIKSSWLVTIESGREVTVEAVPAPVWRRLSLLRGELDTLLTSREFDDREGDVVAVTLTDARRQAEPMARIQQRFPLAVTLTFAPVEADDGAASYAARTRGRGDLEVSMAFLDHVRGESGPDDEVLILQALEAARVAEHSDVVGGVVGVGAA